MIGRIGRKKFIVTIFATGFGWFTWFMLVDTGTLDPPTLTSVSGALVAILIYCSVTPVIGRLHDIDVSGWWAILTLIPFAYLVFLIFLSIKKGSAGKNRYGEVGVEWSN